MYTLDASVHVSALNPHEPASAASQALLRLFHQRAIPLFCPTLLPVEVAADVSRRLDDAGKALALAALVRDWPNQTLVPLDGAVADRAAGLAARWRLRGADAVYAAVAQQYGTTLITLDRQQLERLPAELRTAGPACWGRWRGTVDAGPAPSGHLGMALTGLLISRGANYLHDWIANLILNRLIN